MPFLFSIVLLAMTSLGIGSAHADDYSYSYNPDCPPVFTYPVFTLPPLQLPTGTIPAPVNILPITPISLGLPTGTVPGPVKITPLNSMPLGLPTGTAPAAISISAPVSSQLSLPAGSAPVQFTYPVSSVTGLSLPSGNQSTYTGNFSYTTPIQLAYTSPYVAPIQTVNYTAPVTVAANTVNPASGPAPANGGVVLGALNVRTGASSTDTEYIAVLGALLIAAGYYFGRKYFSKTKSV